MPAIGWCPFQARAARSPPCRSPATSPDRGFAVVGFLPARGAERARTLAHCARDPAAQVLFEAPHRIAALAAALGEACPQRRVTVCRELTKQFETVATLAASGLVAWLDADPNRARGEFVVVLHALATGPAAAGEADQDALLRPLLAALPLKQAVALAAEIGGAARNLLYARALVLKAGAPSEDAGD